MIKTTFINRTKTNDEKIAWKLLITMLIPRNREAVIKYLKVTFLSGLSLSKRFLTRLT